VALRVVPGGFHHPLELGADGGGQVLDAAGDAQPDLVVVQLALVFFQEGSQEGHQAGDFRAGPHPVFGAEGVNREEFHAVIAAGPQDGAQGFGAGAVAIEPRLPALPGPTAVAIHDDGDMAGDAGAQDLRAHASSFRIRVCSRRGPSDRMPTGTPVTCSSRAM